ncbi:uncharacterized protein HMPREF1541_03371 [Cyphellophora europaea CBS 101466]|uniref:Major facilitator superfamily (MFS) profile domain-containing protein n=1 Tax=Cyphellophora europaea (strain CBS 101466) TaxID=1220924 RepID=W2RYN7_CYPE1|nr:uncharacterized protein HMPREF1541_03371 [Cyphellophora europaea CBS 101466]ETN41435.1 hypothetical protein HMPREF1541_03371 [Cyphellophora europaea CBS 101466]
MSEPAESSTSTSTAVEEDKFPWQQLAVLALCRLAEPIAFTSITAYNYLYVQDVRHTEENAAFYAGLLVSGFALAEASTAMLWGTISDKYGRKPIVLSGLAGVALSSLIFGVATNYWVALAARVVGGLLNGNVAVMQTMVAEMVKNPKHEPRAYSMIPFMWFFGSIIGSSMGGLLARPADTWGAFKDTIFDEYPYLLPNLVAAAYIVIAIVVGIIWLKETNIYAMASTKTSHGSADERTPLIREPESAPPTEGEEQKTVARRRSMASIQPVTTGTTVDLRRLSNLTTASSVKPRLSAHDIRGSALEDSFLDDAPPAQGYNRWMILFILQLILMSYHSMAFGSLMPIFLLDEPSPGISDTALDLHGGLGYTLRDVGAFMSINGIVAIFVQGVLFAPVVEWLGVWKTFVLLTVLAPLAYVFPPFLTMIPHAQAPIGIYANLILQNFLLIIIYPCLLILLKDATPTMAMLGQVNGLAMAACSGARTIAPPLVGFIYGSVGSAAGWWSIGAAAIIAGALIPFMKRPPRPDEEDET